MPDSCPNYLAKMLPSLNPAEAAELVPSVGALKALGLEDNSQFTAALYLMEMLKATTEAELDMHMNQGKGFAEGLSCAKQISSSMCVSLCDLFDEAAQRGRLRIAA
ncbi:hypothetical protein [Pseudomonas umsongensis]|uniref:Uncharacterized protein n=1 Tax=Pseudomonas umsongensis TaxID=198618 RepID=A0AAE7DDM7_9PSED|nr:hypothetical protein [Pseudomonas umsongensis]QJC78972.1 hypothetical protein HGP31_11850 [Pseudomonas umsongensis]